MSDNESLFFALTLAAYTIAGITALFGLSYERALFRKVIGITGAGLCAHMVALGLRIHETGHLPVVGDYENSLTFGAAAVIASLIVVFRQRDRTLPIFAVVLPVVILMLGYAAYREPNPLVMTAPYKSPWLYVHVAFYLASFAALAVAAGLGVIGVSKSPEIIKKRLPTLVRSLRFGFSAQGIGIIAGAIWAHYLWGSYWSWDPIEVWSLAAWIFLGLLLHLIRSGILRGQAIGIAAAAAFVFLFYAIFGVSVLDSTFHQLSNI